ncbi:MAG: N-acetylmuramoyl-L-alanine amidase [Selenomonadales bacterium]|nr:N-acetylmuramoyl-L-alanine amidase [Selenomonadales bacterium]
MKKRIALICLVLIGMMMITAAAYASGTIEASDYTVHKGNNNAVLNVRITVDGHVSEVVPWVFGETEAQLRVLMQGAHVGSCKEGKLDGKYARKVVFEKVDEQCSEAVIDFASMLRVEECRTEIRQANGKSIVILTIRLDTSGDEVRSIKGKTILVDAGHGGPDCGAIGASGVYEKDITLAVATELRKQLMAEGANVVMTRTTDRNVSWVLSTKEDKAELAARVAVAEGAQADIFVSIHLNSFTSPDIGGVETFYCQGSFAGERLAYLVQKSLMDQFDLQDRGVKTAKFYVLRHSTMPTILTELAFISNPREEQLLVSPEAQVQFASAILKGLKEYFST